MHFENKLSFASFLTRFLEYPFGTETILELDPANPEVFDRLFPVKGLGVCQDACLAVIKKFCRGYQIPPDKKTRNLFRSRLTSPLVTERTLAGLEVFGMIPEDLLNNPHLPLMTFSEIATCGKISEVYKIQYKHLARTMFNVHSLVPGFRAVPGFKQG